VNEPRFDYDPSTLAARGLLIEEQRTNLCVYSEDFSNAAWNKGSGFTLLSNSVTSPDGTVDASRYTRGTTSSFAYLSQNISGNASIALTYSCWVKSPSGSNTIQLVISDFLLASVISSVIAIGTTWQRLSFSIAAGTLSNTGLIGVGFLLGTGQTIDVWGAQLEAGSFATSYIPTVAATVTRSADFASVNTLSPFYNAVEGTLFVEASSNANVNYPGIAFFAGTGYRAIGFYYGPVSTESGFEVGDVSGQVGIGLTALAKPATNKFAGAYKANDFAACVNGGTVGTDTSGTVPIVSSLKLGVLYNGTYELNGHIRRLAYYPRRLLAAELQALTA
jgi:hypothetical protein